MRVLHFSDQHFAPKTLDKVQPCVDFLLGEARSLSPRLDAIVLTGDLTDHAIDAHSPALAAAAKTVKECADIAPTIVLQGTFSHEPRGVVDLYRLLSGKHRIYTATKIHQVALLEDGSWMPSDGYAFKTLPLGTRMLFTLFPTTNKADVAAVVGARETASAAGDAMATLMNAYAPSHIAAREAGIPTMVLGHGTVSGCMTEHDVPMAGLDHEFNLGGLYTLQASAVALGHIHKHQVWSHGHTTVAYAGSVARLHYGEVGSKGGLLWEVEADGASLTQIVTPTRESITVTFRGVPSAEELRALGEDLRGKDVRVCWEVNEDERHKVDRLGMETVLRELGAIDFKLEGTVNVISRQRTAGMNKLGTLAEKLSLWATYTGTDPSGLAERLAVLESEDGSGAAAAVLAACEQRAAQNANLTGAEQASNASSQTGQQEALPI